MLVYLAAAVAAALGLSRILALFQVRGDSMLPALREGDWVLACRCLNRVKLRSGSLVIVHQEAPPRTLIKRIAATAYDSVPMDLGGALDRVPPACYLLCGDNPRLSVSHRYLGPVRAEQVWGRVWLVVWPWRRLRRLGQGQAVVTTEGNDANADSPTPDDG